MKKLLLTLSVFAGIMTANAQQVNGSFDDAWVDCIPWTSSNNTTAKGIQPFGWTISNVIGVKGLGATEVGTQITENSNFSVQLTNKSIMGQNIPAYITLGTSWATSTGTFIIKNKDGGSFGGIKFSYKPDALKFSYKRIHGEKNKEEKATVVAYLWKGTYTQYAVPGENITSGSPQTVTMYNRDRQILEKENMNLYGGIEQTPDAKRIATIEHYIEGDAADWTELTLPFLYTSDDQPEMLNIIFASNNYFDDTNIGANNELWIDNVTLIYNSELASLNYDGKEYFQKGTTAYSIDAVYDDSKLTCTSNGKGATIEPSYNEDEALLTITVKGNDVSVNPENVHTYTVQFAKPQPEITEYENDLLVAVNGQGAPIQKAKIQLIKELDGTTSLALNNFVLGSGDEALAVGNIKLTNLEIKDNKIQATQTINITEGDDPAYEEWFGPQLGEVPVSLNATLINNQTIEAVIDIPLAPGFMVIKVTFAETQTYTDGEALSLTTGLTNVVYNRIFPAGWSTVCLPFATTTAAFGEEVKAQAFTSADANGLNFTEVTDLEANKPYLIYFPSATEAPIYMSAEVSSTTPVAVTYGDFTFCGSYAASIKMAGKYGVADQGEEGQKLMLGSASSTLGATRAYFTKKGAQPAEINLNLWGDATGIDAVTNDAETFDVYNLQGVMVRQNVNTLNGLQKGIYIVNGKKVSVK